jgi:ATP-binding cassette, subfamily B, bacterial
MAWGGGGMGGFGGGPGGGLGNGITHSGSPGGGLPFAGIPSELLAGVQRTLDREPAHPEPDVSFTHQPPPAGGSPSGISSCSTSGPSSSRPC